MPLEIRELHIKAVISAEKEQGASTRAIDQQETDTDALVAACVAQVLDILKEKAER